MHYVSLRTRHTATYRQTPRLKTLYSPRQSPPVLCPSAIRFLPSCTLRTTHHRTVILPTGILRAVKFKRFVLSFHCPSSTNLHADNRLSAHAAANRTLSSTATPADTHRTSTRLRLHSSNSQHAVRLFHMPRSSGALLSTQKYSVPSNHTARPTLRLHQTHLH